MDYREASLELRKIGLRVTTESITSDLYEIGYVISTSPAYGEVIEAGNAVTIYVSSGGSGEKVTVPNFLGKTESATLADVISAGLLVGEVTYEESGDYDAGLVMKQSISSGSEAFKNSVIDFVVSLGAPETTEAETETQKTPNLRQKQKTERKPQRILIQRKKTQSLRVRYITIPRTIQKTKRLINGANGEHNGRRAC